jgi:hypothetical protein
MPRLDRDIIGKQFGRLTVLDECRKVPSGTEWKCKCECGNEVYVYRGKLTSGHTNSCGCLTSTLDGLSNHRLYRTWWGIKERCYSERHASYHNYGAKGIKMCEEWQDFKTFYNWAMENGYQDDLTIDRHDSTKDYSPENCQWITLAENVAKSNAEKPHRKTDYLYYGISPQGIRYEFANAADFSKEHELNANSLRRVARGERPHYKNWKFGFTDIPNT